MNRPCCRHGFGSILLFATFLHFPKLGRILVIAFAAMVLLGLWWSTFPPN